MLASLCAAGCRAWYSLVLSGVHKLNTPSAASLSVAISLRATGSLLIAVQAAGAGPIPAHDLAPLAPGCLQVPEQFSALSRLQELVIQSAAKTTSVAPCVFSLPELRRLKLEDMANVRQHSPCLTGLAM